MAEVRTEIDLFDSWYRIADVNKDGKVGGGEAVPFLQRSGLSKDALFKVSGTPCLRHGRPCSCEPCQWIFAGDLRSAASQYSPLARRSDELLWRAQIWSVVAGESAFLTKQQFYSAMRLISVAQVLSWASTAPCAFAMLHARAIGV